MGKSSTSFAPGNKLSKGKPVGTLNRKTAIVEEILANQKYCPITSLIRKAKKAEEMFDQESERESSGRISPMESNAAKYLKISADTDAEIASYVYAKRKSVEQITSSPTEGMTIQQKLDALKLLQKSLQAQLNEEARTVENESGAT